jgi:hypothetical protein
MKHPYAEILAAVAEGKQIQWLQMPSEWLDQGPSATLFEVAHGRYPPERYRIKPATIRIGEHDVPEPLREMPSKGTNVYWPSFSAVYNPDELTDYAEVGEYPDSLPRLLAMGLLHLSGDAAKAHAEALISLTKQP